MATPPTPLDPIYAGENSGPHVVASIIIVASLSTLFAAARLYVRLHIVRKFQFDDYMIVLSVVCSWMSVGFSTAAVHSGSGRHIQTLSGKQISGAIQFTLFGFVPGILSYVLPKMTVVTLLARLLNPSRWHLVWLWSMCIICLITMMGSVAIAFAQCQPTKSQWDLSVKPDFCWSKWILVKYSWGSCAFSAFVDLYLSIYPAVVLYKIQLPRRKKIGLSIALGVGSISTVVAIYKITVLKGLASPDFTFDSCNLTIWTIVEGSVIIIAACIPLLQPLLEKIRKRSWSSNRKSQSLYLTPKNASGHHKGYADVELSNDKSRIRKARRQFDMESILETRNYDDHLGAQPVPAGSQERILEEDETGLVTQTSRRQIQNKNIPPDPHNGIHRTDEIRISYAEDNGNTSNSHRHQDSWS
ncbi:uncharacterized protein JN550_004279 [Neoarthrinium moseri]|uniref:uncharacterized protein n=1 Tax=Neoarthrinium moseri TaxID=1658444 RepID=UPI001FDC91A7|nr:uncharacterized protein JN550_004279 [Neoarthrinium moseri]KAI1872076.1 hypothetical protein JN550_004279 [Neoarthrinium moseri]